MTPEECAVRVVEQARITVDHWFRAETIDALRLAIAAYDQAHASRMQMWTRDQPKPTSPAWPCGEYPYRDTPGGVGHNRCEGRCSAHGDCEGDVLTYMVFDGRGGCWGSFRYCTTAKESDEKSGFRLEQRI